ncbi:uncharacterized protein [Antedon mediterranea]|uniref:uncharacterized protein n=1 Tax=Antedon mediterranea TaxID=105859 RepID=UPI003AF5944B
MFGLSSVPYLPVQYFKPTVQTYWNTLCLVLRPPQESLWIYTLVLFCYSAFVVLTISLEILLIICQLQRQKNTLVMAIPMEARVIRREIVFAKRFSFIILATTVCWIPVLVIGFNAYAGSSISTGLIQWVFGFVLPFESIVNPLLYLATLGMEQGRVGLFLHSCKQKVSGSGTTIKMKLQQLTGSVSMPRDMYICREPDNDQIESLQRSTKSPPPTDVKWLQTLQMAGHEKGKSMFGKIEWTSRTSNASRQGMIKLFSKSHYKRWKNEISTLEKITFAGGHPNVLMKHWHSDNHKTIVIGGPPSTQSSILAVERYLCSPFFEYGNLQNFLLEHQQGKLTDTTIHKITSHISEGLCFLHSRNIIHNRIQATNILIGGGNSKNSEFRVVISEFGKAKDVSTIRRRKRGGTLQKQEEANRTIEDHYLNVPGSISLKVFHDSEWAENVELFVADVRAFGIMLCEMLLWSSTDNCRKHLSASGKNNFAFLKGDEETENKLNVETDKPDQTPQEYSPKSVDAEVTSSPLQIRNIKSIKESLELSGLNRYVAEDHPVKTAAYVGGGHRHHFVQSMPPPVFNDLTTKHLDMLLEEAHNQVMEMEKESEKLEGINTRKPDEVLNHRVLYDRKYRESLVNLLKEFQEENEQMNTLKKQCELTCATKSLEEELSKNSRTLTKEVNKKTVEKESNESRSSSDSSGTETGDNDLFGLDSTNDLLQLLPDGSSKRKSICSTDSGISSQQESLSNFNTKKNNKKDNNSVLGTNNKVPGWSRHLNSHSPTPFHFRNVPRSRTTIYAKGSGDNELPSFSVLSQMIETWIQSHADQDCEYRSSILDGVQKSRANIPETIPETDSDKRYSDLRKACSTSAIDDVSWQETEKVPSSPTTPEPKHKSSLSQFYVRKTGAKSPCFTKVKNNPLQVQYEGSQYSNQLYKKWRSADNVNIHKNGAASVCPKCQLPDGPTTPGCELDMSDSLINSLPGQCCCISLNNSLNQPPSPQLRNTIRNENIYTPMVSIQQKLNLDVYMGEIPELCTTNIDTADIQYCEVFLPSGINKHHQYYLGELQRQFPWLPEVTVDVLRDDERKSKAFSNWLQILRRDKGYLHLQMVKIVERCWREEPPLASQEIKDLLLKCLPETPL